MKIKVGETIKYDIEIVGEPLPEVTWVANNKQLKSGGRCKWQTQRGKHVFKVTLKICIHQL